MKKLGKLIITWAGQNKISNYLIRSEIYWIAQKYVVNESQWKNEKWKSMKVNEKSMKHIMNTILKNQKHRKTCALYYFINNKCRRMAYSSTTMYGNTNIKPFSDK